MLNIHEFRVRPVNRFVLTEYRRDGSASQNAGGAPRVIAELPNAELANELGRALQRAHPGSTLTNSEGEHTEATGLQFVIVEAHVFEPGALVYYAYNEQEAVITQTNAQMMHGREFRIFERRVAHDPNAPAGIGAAINENWAAAADTSTHYPARFGLQAKVMRAATNIAQVGVGQHGILHSYPAEEAEVVGVHFYPGKVCYDVTFPSGRRGETVDSVELTTP